MTGILAGFAFTAFVVLMTPAQNDERRSHGKPNDNGVLMTPFSGFIALIMATLCFSPVAADSPDTFQGRADSATALFVDGVPIAFAVLMLFHGLALLIEATGLARHAVWTARVVAVVGVPTIGFAYLVNGAVDTDLARPTNTLTSCLGAAPPGFSSVLGILLPILISAALIPSLQPARLRAWCRKHTAIPPIAVLVFSLGTVFFGARIPTDYPGYLFSPTTINVLIVFLFFLFAALGIAIALGYSTRVSAKSGDVRFSRACAVGSRGVIRSSSGSSVVVQWFSLVPSRTRR